MRNDKTKDLFLTLFNVLIVLSTILAVKVVKLGPFLLSIGLFCYATTYLLTDVIGELWGEETAKRAVKLGGISQLLVALICSIAVRTPGTDAEMQIAMQTVFGSNLWFVFGGLIAYYLSQFLDVWVFHRIRDKLKSRGRGWRGVWNLTSKMVSQIVDTAVYVGIGYGLGMGVVFESGGFTLLLHFALGQYLVKSFAALIGVPVFYLLTHKQEET